MAPPPAAAQAPSLPVSEGPEPPNSSGDHASAFIEPEQRQAMIAEAAYYGAERRGFESGRDLDDWYGAEREIDSMLERSDIPVACGL